MKQKAYKIYFPKVEHKSTFGCQYTYSSYTVPHYFRTQEKAQEYLRGMPIYTAELEGTMRIWKKIWMYWFQYKEGSSKTWYRVRTKKGYK